MGVPWETVTLTALGKNRQLYFDMLEEGEQDERAGCLVLLTSRLISFYR